MDYNTFEDKQLCYGNREPAHNWDYNKPITYTMDYEDTTKIPFFIEEEYWDKLMIISVYDFRHDLLFEQHQFVDETGHVFLNIDKDLSQDIMKRGIYYCGIQAIEVFLTDEGEYNYGDNVCTILSQNDCIINVR